MSKPTAFLSSTYLDLKETRDTVAEFLHSLGWSTILFERGGVYWDQNQPLDESCYREVSNAHLLILIVGGRYGAPASEEGRPARRSGYSSITKKEYLTAREHQIPAFIFVSSGVMNDYRTWRINPKEQRKNLKFASVDNQSIFELIQMLATQSSPQFLHEYNLPSDMTREIQNQIAGLTVEAFKKQREIAAAPLVPVNGYKFFYFRTQTELSLRKLARMVKVDRKLLQRLERVKKRTGLLSVDLFEKCRPDVLDAIERALDAEGRLKAGKPDDFLSNYILFYEYKLRNRKPPKAKPTSSSILAPESASLFPAKAVVFDFEGTLTARTPGENRTTWEQVWEALGYAATECSFYLAQFRREKIGHQEWCDITCARFREKCCSQGLLDEIASRMHLLPGTTEALEAMRSAGIKLYLVSGSIKQLVQSVLGDMKSYFEEIKANEFIFDHEGELARIQGTPHDFAGKADYLRRVMTENQLSELEVVFVGNSMNDDEVCRSGARTLCINPHFTDFSNHLTWTHFIKECPDLRLILPYIHPALHADSGRAASEANLTISAGSGNPGTQNG